VKALSGKRTWQAIFALVAYHELFCDDGQLLSEEADRQRAKRPIVVDLAITITALHLLRRIPPKADPFHRVHLFHQLLKGHTCQSQTIPSPLLRLRTKPSRLRPPKPLTRRQRSKLHPLLWPR
jgi:hypothetical protein